MTRPFAGIGPATPRQEVPPSDSAARKRRPAAGRDMTIVTFIHPHRSDRRPRCAVQMIC